MLVYMCFVVVVVALCFNVIAGLSYEVYEKCPDGSDRKRRVFLIEHPFFGPVIKGFIFIILISGFFFLFKKAQLELANRSYSCNSICVSAPAK